MRNAPEKGRKVTSLVLVEKKDGYAVLTLNRPDKANAINIAMAAEFREALADLEEVGAIVVTGAGDRTFCSGVDRSERGKTRNWGTSLGVGGGQFWADTLDAMARHPAVFISAVNGFALGGGLTLVNNSELAIASSTAQFGMPEMGFGHIPAQSGPTTVKRILPKHAAWMVFTSERIDASTAQRTGIVNEVVEPEALLDRAVEIAQLVGSRNRYALAFAKRALREMADMPWSTAIEYTGQMAALAISTEQLYGDAHE